MREEFLTTNGRVFVTMKEVLEYNLVEIDFNWEWNYIPSDDVISHFVADDSTIDAFAKTPEIEYDENNCLALKKLDSKKINHV